MAAAAKKPKKKVSLLNDLIDVDVAVKTESAKAVAADETTAKNLQSLLQQLETTVTDATGSSATSAGVKKTVVKKKVSATATTTKTLAVPAASTAPALPSPRAMDLTQVAANSLDSSEDLNLGIAASAPAASKYFSMSATSSQPSSAVNSPALVSLTPASIDPHTVALNALLLESTLDLDAPVPHSEASPVTVTSAVPIPAATTELALALGRASDPGEHVDTAPIVSAVDVSPALAADLAIAEPASVPSTATVSAGDAALLSSASPLSTTSLPVPEIITTSSSVPENTMASVALVPPPVPDVATQADEANGTSSFSFPSSLTSDHADPFSATTTAFSFHMVASELQPATSLRFVSPSLSPSGSPKLHPIDPQNSMTWSMLTPEEHVTLPPPDDADSNLDLIGRSRAFSHDALGRARSASGPSPLLGVAATIGGVSASSPSTRRSTSGLLGLYAAAESAYDSPALSSGAQLPHISAVSTNGLEQILMDDDEDDEDDEVQRHATLPRQYGGSASSNSSTPTLPSPSSPSHTSASLTSEKATGTLATASIGFNTNSSTNSSTNTSSTVAPISAPALAPAATTALLDSEDSSDADSDAGGLTVDQILAAEDAAAAAAVATAAGMLSSSSPQLPSATTPPRPGAASKSSTVAASAISPAGVFSADSFASVTAATVRLCLHHDFPLCILLCIIATVAAVACY
jgi:hypothetical protein